MADLSKDKFIKQVEKYDKGLAKELKEQKDTSIKNKLEKLKGDEW